MLESLVYLLAHMFMAYSLMYFVIPRFLLKQKYWTTAALVVAVCLVASLISSFLSVTVIVYIRHIITGQGVPAHERPLHVNVFLSLMAGLRGGITIGGIAASIKLMKYWYVKEQRNLQLQKENIASQLQLLTAQIHPHFLFNTLNNIYSYTQNTAPVASKLVSGLSDMLRFILYESNEPLVPLSKEIKMIDDYMSLEKIRYGNKLDLQIDVPTAVDHLYIAPLLLLPLVENCFKHGTSNVLEQPWISLRITIRDKQMQMKLLNGKAGTVAKADSASGIGIKNVQKRLELLYPGNHELVITDEEDVFIVNLKIELERKEQTILKSSNLSESVHA
jgi:LytS/YehU family sensor histidine kinase